MPDRSEARLRFQQYVEDFGPSLYRVAYRMTGCSSTAEDLVQETFVAAWQGLHKLRDPLAVRAWMFSILRNLSLKQRRKGMRNGSLNGLSSEPVAVDRGLETSEREDWLQFGLAQLPELDRLMLLMHVMEDLSVGEIGEVLGMPKGTVMSRLHRARKKLEPILADQEKGGDR